MFTPMEEKKKIIWTIGHSTRPFEEFTELLREFVIEQIIDIRSFPGSRKFPQYNRENLEVSLPENGFRYELISKLGGRRKVKPDSVNIAWEHPAFRGYADYMETAGFLEGMATLEETALRYRTAIMCAEAVWWRCHRSMVSDYLKSTGWTVIHIMGKEQSQEHPYTAAASIIDGKLNYQVTPGTARTR